jgi:hypothetical protein
MLTYNPIFSLIIKKIINTENNIFLSTFDNSDTIDFIFKSIFIMYDNKYLKNNEKIYVYSNKFIFLKDILNIFTIKDIRQDEILDYFCKIQKTYHSLNRFAFNYKFKKAKIVVNTDMQLNEINENDNNIICIFQEKAKYLFKLYDLLKIINISLTNSFEFFSEPLCIKNPYNNIPFNKSVLYYIHYYLLQNPNLLLKISFIDLFLKFHSCHFNLTNFLSTYEYLLRELSIKNYIKNNTNDDLYEEILIMIEKFNKNRDKYKKIIIDKEFPKEKIVNIFKPYLSLYIESRYLLVSYLKNKALYDLNKKLNNFQKFNPFFTRSKVKYIKKYINNQIKIVQVIKEMNDNYIPFELINNNNFLEDHLTYKYMHYIVNNNMFIVDIYNNTEEDLDTEEEELDNEEEELDSIS